MPVAVFLRVISSTWVNYVLLSICKVYQVTVLPLLLNFLPVSHSKLTGSLDFFSRLPETFQSQVYFTFYILHFCLSRTHFLKLYFVLAICYWHSKPYKNLVSTSASMHFQDILWFNQSTLEISFSCGFSWCALAQGWMMQDYMADKNMLIVFRKISCFVWGFQFSFYYIVLAFLNYGL